MGVPRIIVDHTLEDGMVVTHNIEVPTVANTPWQKIGKLPTADDIKVATKKIILEKLPNLLHPGYKKLCDEFDIKVTSTAEYTSPWYAVELRWGNGKGWVADSRNQKLGRSCGEVVNLLRQKWYSIIRDGEGKPVLYPVDAKVWFDHCHNVINKDLAIMQNDHQECPLSGDDITNVSTPTSVSSGSQFRILSA